MIGEAAKEALYFFLLDHRTYIGIESCRLSMCCTTKGPLSVTALLSFLRWIHSLHSVDELLYISWEVHTASFKESHVRDLDHVGDPDVSAM